MSAGEMERQTTIDWTRWAFDEADLTAVAIGADDELDGATRGAIRDAIADDANLRKEFEAIRATAQRVEAALAAEVAAEPAATASRESQELGDGATRTDGDRARRVLTWPVLTVGAIAATILIVLAAGDFFDRLVLGTKVGLTRVSSGSSAADGVSREAYDGQSIGEIIFESSEDEAVEDEEMLAESGEIPDAGGGDAAEDAPALRQAAEARSASVPAGQYSVSPAASGDVADRDTRRGTQNQLDPSGAYPAPGLPPDFNREGYQPVEDNPFERVADAPLSTFSIDVDTASYSNIRRFLTQMNVLPPASAVRIEEMVNYFDYDYPPPPADSDTPFAAHVEVADAPWRPEHRLVRIGLKGREVERVDRPRANLVFLIDVSGSMQGPGRLPLVKQSLTMLLDVLEPTDTVGIVTYAGQSGVALEPTRVEHRREIQRVIDALGAGGSTAGAAGIESAYDLASDAFIEGGVNRVILLTDGDFNVGITSHGELEGLIQRRAREDVFLSVLGFGMGNYQDGTLELLADKGNGNYAYIDDEREAHRVFVERTLSTLVTIAKDVKIQVEFNPAEVQAYWLIGYENRMLAARDFNDDTKDAGEIGAGHTVTALYEVVPHGVPLEAPGVDPLRYQQDEDDAVDPPLADAAFSGELMLLKLRYKPPEGDVSTRVEFPVRDRGADLSEASDDFRFAAAVAGFGMILRDSPHAGSATLDSMLELADDSIGPDPQGDRREFLELVEIADRLR